MRDECETVQLSVIIPTFNRGGAILGTLEGLCQQTVSPSQFEVIVVDDASDDDTVDRVSSFLNERRLHSWKCISLRENGGRAVAINEGVRVAAGRVVAFTDDDIVPAPEWIAAHLEHYEHEDQDVSVVGSVSYPPEWVRRSNLVRYHNGTYLGSPGNRVTKRLESGAPLPPSHFAGGNSSLLRDTFIDVGMYDYRMRRGQDGELAIRLTKRGVRFVFEPKAKVIHFANAASSYDKWISSFQRFYRENAHLVFQKHPDEYYRFAHWFVERPNWGKERFRRSAIKSLVRFVARPRIGRVLCRFLEALDGNRMAYHRVLFKYVLTAMAIEAVNQRRSS